MLEKILSSGREGSERAAIDVALEVGIPCGGAVPGGGETPPAPEGFAAFPGAGPDGCLERNVVDADGTLMITFGRLTGGTDLARCLSLRHGRQLLHIDAAATDAPAAAELIRSWIEVYNIAVLHVTGFDEENPAVLHAAAASILAFTLEPLQRQAVPAFRGRLPAPGGRPATLEQAVRRLEAEMTFREKAIFAHTASDATNRLFSPMVRSVATRLGLAGGNRLLLGSCRAAANQREMGPEEAALLVLEALWRLLRKTHGIRVVK